MLSPVSFQSGASGRARARDPSGDPSSLGLPLKGMAYNTPGIDFWGWFTTHRIHGAAIYGNMDPINIPQMLAYIPYCNTWILCFIWFTT